MKKIFTFIFLLVSAVINSNAQSTLVINEVDYDQPGADSAEFIELYNAASTPLTLNNYSVILFNGNNSTRYDSIALPNISLAAGSFFVICAGHPGKVANCDTARSGFTIQNGSPDAIAIRDHLSGNIIDAVSYEGNCIPPYIEGNGVPLAESDTLNSAPPGSPNNFLSISRFPDGADTDDDSTDFHRTCATPGAANVNTAAGCTGTVGVKTIVASTAIEMFPNPSSGVVNINLNGAQNRNATVTVSNLLGSEIKKVALKNSDSHYQLDLSEFQDGIYFVKVKTDGSEYLQRIILKK